MLFRIMHYAGKLKPYSVVSKDAGLIRIALIQRFIAIFGKDRIVNVFADREFIGEQWFTWLIEQDINFCIRVKKTSLSPII